MTAFRKTFRVGDFTQEGLLGRVVIQLKINTRLVDTSTPMETIEHDDCFGINRLSITGEVKERRLNGRWVDAGGGQCIGALKLVDAFAKPGERGTTPSGWDAGKRDRLVDLWENWHLNDMIAGCAHQEVVYEENDWGRKVPSIELTKPCPITGYKYGSKWLVKPMTPDIYREIEALLEVGL
jgi:hypothetical protein